MATFFTVIGILILIVSSFFWWFSASLLDNGGRNYDAYIINLVSKWITAILLVLLGWKLLG